MKRYADSILIQAAPARAWTILADVERWPEWTASMRRVKKLDAHPIGLGAKVRVIQPKLLPADFTVIRWEPGRSFAWESRIPGLRAVADHVITAQGDDCLFALDLVFSGPLAELVGWFADKLVRDYLRLEAEGLKRAAESALVPSITGLTGSDN
jgi:Polyketide cyclase / dehydrase and lipid transport